MQILSITSVKGYKELQDKADSIIQLMIPDTLLKALDLHLKSLQKNLHLHLNLMKSKFLVLVALKLKASHCQKLNRQNEC